MTDPNLLSGRYRLLERRDHTGTTWRSRDELLHRDVIVTEVRLPPLGPHRDWLIGQIRAAADLRHPGVVTLHDVISAPDRMWLVLESVEGRSLIQTVRADGPLPSERAAEVGLRVMDALAAAHARGIRLAATPDTVLLTPDGRVVLTGVASPVPADDLRDLGTTLFTAVEGRAPHTGSPVAPRMPDGTPVADLAPASDPSPTGSGPLSPLVEGLLAADPALRPDATSVRLTLERIAPHSAASRRKPLITAAVAAVLLLTGAAFWLWLRPSEPPPAGPPPLPASFAKAPDPCALISKEQMGRLFLETAPSRGDDNRCSWQSQNTGQPRNLQYLLWTQTFHYPSGERAHDAYARFLAQESGKTRSAAGLSLTVAKPARAVPGIASEAYTFEVTNDLTYCTGVVFRAANLVVVVQYQRGGGEDASGSTRQGAFQTTRWILETLSRTR
ncbi:hypothetical protein [Streptosporangium sp. NPDC000396]|uniref:hypothetical protein n=1 Tax=Streptosporangium sp. NPDC000396 TaxID=3366185 RepID=UPI00369458EF